MEQRSRDISSMHSKPVLNLLIQNRHEWKLQIGQAPFALFHVVCFQDLLVFLPVGSPLSMSSSIPSSLAATPPSPAPPGPSSGMNANALPFYPTSDTVESVVGEWEIVHPIKIFILFYFILFIMGQIY